jgi:uncharacterized protein
MRSARVGALALQQRSDGWPVEGGPTMTTAHVDTRTAPAGHVVLGAPSLLQVLALHLVPGALMTVAFVLLEPLADAAGFPPIAALLVAIVAILIPVELALVIRAGDRGAGVRDAIANAVPYREHVAGRRWLWLVPALILAAFVGFGITASVEPQITSALFGWLPDWFVRPIDLDRTAAYTRSAWLVTLAGYFVVNGLLGPIVEETYFRGYLLPRLERLGRWAPLVNVSLFSLYHFWSPWQLIARILGLGPTVYAVRWTRNIYLGMIVHASLNTLSVVIVAAQILGRAT